MMMTLIALLLISLGNDGGPRAIPPDGTERPVSDTPQGLVGRSSCEIPREVSTYRFSIGNDFKLEDIRFEALEVVALVQHQPGASGECDNKVLAVLTVPPKRRGEFVVFECWRAGSRRPAVAPGIVGVGTNREGRLRVFVPRVAWAADTRSATFKQIDPKTVRCELLGED
jgi:hypothetical protein